MGFVKCNSERSVQKHSQLVSNDTCQVLSFKTPEHVLLVRVNYTPPLMELYSPSLMNKKPLYKGWEKFTLPSRAPR